jgi:hypothetical protein
MESMNQISYKVNESKPKNSQKYSKQLILKDPLMI